MAYRTHPFRFVRTRSPSTAIKQSQINYFSISVVNAERILYCTNAILVRARSSASQRHTVHTDWTVLREEEKKQHKSTWNWGCVNVFPNADNDGEFYAVELDAGGKRGVWCVREGGVEMAQRSRQVISSREQGKERKKAKMKMKTNGENRRKRANKNRISHENWISLFLVNKRPFLSWLESGGRRRRRREY